MDLEWAVLVAAISAWATLFIGLITRDLVKRQFEEQFESNKKQHQVQGLLEAFKILDKEDHREFRKTVFIQYFEYFENGDVKVFKHNAVANVMADFDIMGKLVKSNNIDRDEFLEEYGSLAYRCWKCLEDHIIHEREERRFPPFMTWFEWLAKEGYKYWKEGHKPQGYDFDDTVLFHPHDPAKKIDFRSKPKWKGKG